MGPFTVLIFTLIQVSFEAELPLGMIDGVFMRARKQKNTGSYGSIMSFHYWPLSLRVGKRKLKRKNEAL